MAIHKVEGVDGDANFPKKFVRLHCTEAISAGEWVSIDTGDTTNGLGGSVEKALATTNGCVGVVGVATETTTAAGVVKIQTAGKFENAFVTTSITANKALVVDTTAGRADEAAATDLVSPCAITLETAASNLADVMIIDQGYF
tara:strand:+ start:83 stop:511 length:429 start_codon:yes stop_codon:yes gene_type:complete